MVGHVRPVRWLYEQTAQLADCLFVGHIADAAALS